MRVREINVPAMIETLALFSLCLLVGTRISTALHGGALELPTFLCVLFVGVVLRNVLAWLGWYQVFDRCVSVLGNVALALFLAMAMMAIQLGQMASVAVPLLVILGVQSIAMAAWAMFVTFPGMGGNHDAMVIAAGHCGFGMGGDTDGDCQHAVRFRQHQALAPGIPHCPDGLIRNFSNKTKYGFKMNTIPIIRNELNIGI